MILKIFKKINLIIMIGDCGLGIGDWGWGFGDWGLGIVPNPQSPIPNPQSPIPILIKLNFLLFIYIKYISLLYKI